MMSKFEMSNLGMLHYFIGLEARQCFHGVLIHREGESMLLNFTEVQLNELQSISPTLEFE